MAPPLSRSTICVRPLQGKGWAARFPGKKLTPRPCPKLLLLTVPAPRPSERCASSPPGPPRHGTRTALISLGIPKLVRFHKSALALRNSGIIIPLGRRRRAAFWHCRVDARMARLRRDSASGSELGHEVSCPVGPAKARWGTENRENNREFLEYQRGLSVSFVPFPQCFIA